MLANGYYTCFDIVYQDLKKNQYSFINNLMRPLMYLLRHSLELYLKCFIGILNNVMKSKIRNIGHDLSKLFKNIEYSLFHSYPQFTQNDIKFVKEFVNEFHREDAIGDKNRYATDVN